MITRLISLGEMLMLLEYASQCSASTCSAPEPAIAPTIAPAISKAIKKNFIFHFMYPFRLLIIVL